MKSERDKKKQNLPLNLRKGKKKDFSMNEKVVTFKTESQGRGERNLHEMGMLEMAISGEIVNHRYFLLRFGLGPNLGSLRTDLISLFPLLREL